MKHIKKFNTYEDYQSYVNSGNFIQPNVSKCINTNETYCTMLNTTYKITCDPYNGHDYVEIGGIKWATMNIGANNITDTGLYFQWGDTQGYTASQCGEWEGQKYFGWEDYKYCNGTSSPNDTDMTKYNSTDGKTVLEVSDDAVTAVWGGGWRMPTTAEFQALGNAVNTTWTQIDDVYGLLCTDKTDNSKTLFFPACGYCDRGEVLDVDNFGCYWSNSLVTDSVGGIISGHSMFYVYDSYFYWDDFESRNHGYPVRGVVD